MLCYEKYAKLYSPQSSYKKSTPDKDSKDKINISIEDNTNITQNILEIFNQNDNEHFNEQKINPNKERVFRNIHCFFYLDNEPLIIIGPDLGYFIWIFTLVSFFSIFSVFFKNFCLFYYFLICFGIYFFAVSYIMLMVVNPGIPSEKKHYDINDLNFNCKQCKICNCIYHKDDFKNVSHSDECGICVEGCEQGEKIKIFLNLGLFLLFLLFL